MSYRAPIDKSIDWLARRYTTGRAEAPGVGLYVSIRQGPDELRLCDGCTQAVGLAHVVAFARAAAPVCGTRPVEVTVWLRREQGMKSAVVEVVPLPPRQGEPKPEDANYRNRVPIMDLHRVCARALVEARSLP